MLPTISTLFVVVVELVPIPTLPSTNKPLVEAGNDPEYEEPIETFPSTSNLLCGVVVPIPTFPSTKRPLVGAIVDPE